MKRKLRDELRSSGKKWVQQGKALVFPEPTWQVEGGVRQAWVSWRSCGECHLGLCELVLETGRPQVLACLAYLKIVILNTIYIMLGYQYGGFHQWGIPNSWMVYGKSIHFNG